MFILFLRTALIWLRLKKEIQAMQGLCPWLSSLIYHTRAIITRGLYTFYPLFEVYLCTVTFGLIYGWYSRVVSNQERDIVARVRYLYYCQKKLEF